MKVVHVITCLDDGGAEAVLYRMCLTSQGVTHAVISLRGEGKYGPLLREAGVSVYCLNMSQGSITPKGMWQLYKLLRSSRADVVQTWMYHADLIGGVIARLAGKFDVFWGLHNSNLEKGKTKTTTRLVARINSLLSHVIPKRIISCSQNAVSVHRQMGYDADKFTVIPNGYNVQHFTPDENARCEIREELVISDSVPLIGMVARFDPQKDHANLIEALAILRLSINDFKCLLVGNGMSDTNDELQVLLAKYNVADKVHLLGPRHDIPAIMSALDIHVLSSSSEAFPNVLCEAMACGTPCVVTDVGDAGVIIGDTGWTVPAKSPGALSEALFKAINQCLSNTDDWSARCVQSRKRILENYTLDLMVEKYLLIWQGASVH